MTTLVFFNTKRGGQKSFFLHYNSEGGCIITVLVILDFGLNDSAILAEAGRAN